MRKGLNIQAAFAEIENFTREEGLLERISESLLTAQIASNASYIRGPNQLAGKNGLFLYHENGRDRTHLCAEVKKDHYSIHLNDEYDNIETPMDSKQIEHATGETNDYDTFMSALEYILALHFPTAAKDGRLEEVMQKFRRSENTGPAVDANADKLEPVG